MAMTQTQAAQAWANYKRAEEAAGRVPIGFQDWLRSQGEDPNLVPRSTGRTTNMSQGYAGGGAATSAVATSDAAARAGNPGAQTAQQFAGALDGSTFPGFGAAGRGMQLGTPVTGSTAPSSDLSSRARDAMGRASQGVEQGQGVVDQATDGAMGNAAGAAQQGEQRADQFSGRADQLLSNQTNALQELYGDAFAGLDDLVQDPRQLYERALAAQLAQAGSTPGGAAAQRGAMFDAAQNAPALLAQAEEEARQTRVARSQMFNDLVKSMSDDQLAIMQGGLAAADTVLTTLAGYDQWGAQLDSSERMWLGNLGLDIQRLWADNELQWQGLTVDERLRLLEIEAQKYGIDRQLQGIMAGIEAGQQFTFRDLANGILGLGSAFVAGK